MIFFFFVIWFLLHFPSKQMYQVKWYLWKCNVCLNVIRTIMNESNDDCMSKIFLFFFFFSISSLHIRLSLDLLLLFVVFCFFFHHFCSSLLWICHIRSHIVTPTFLGSTKKITKKKHSIVNVNVVRLHMCMQNEANKKRLKMTEVKCETTARRNTKKNGWKKKDTRSPSCRILNWRWCRGRCSSCRRHRRHRRRRRRHSKTSSAKDTLTQNVFRNGLCQNVSCLSHLCARRAHDEQKRLRKMI